MASNQKNNCLHYWDLCPVIPIEAAIALWCDVEPSLLKNLNYSTSCMDVKRELLVQALYHNKLEYITTPDAYYSARIDELICKDQVRIKKDSLRRWFLDMPLEDRPAFLFDESRIGNIPDGGEVAEMNANMAIAIMALLLSKKSKKYQTGERPNAKAINDDILPLAELFFRDKAKLSAFNKKISNALKNFEQEKKDDDSDMDISF